MVFGLLAPIRTLTNVIPNIAIRIISAERGGLQGEDLPDSRNAEKTRSSFRKDTLCRKDTLNYAA